MYIWNIAIYARVSTDKKDQQESIPAQIQSLKQWIEDKKVQDKNGIYNLINIYKDEGVSGSSFDRESFLRLKEDIEKKKINMVVIRDLSRLGRNYIIAGYYIENYFKANEVRLVSILDNVDTLEEDSDIVPFKNILNEMYIKDCSKKIKDGLKQRMLRGSSIASKPPYGYRFQEFYDNNVRQIGLIPRNDETTEIVKEIYNLYLQGWGMGRIATYLNSKNIKSPAALVRNFSKMTKGLWTSNTIKSILTNPKYGGVMLQGRWRKVSYKVKKVRVVPKDQWIMGGEFEGIISKETFYKVQCIIKSRSKSFRQKRGNIHLFSGILKCKECGGSLVYRAEYKGYKCSNSQVGGKRCTPHSIKEQYLREIISKSLKKHIEEHIDKNEIDKVTKFKFYNIIQNTDKYEQIKNQLSNLDIHIEQIYMDKLNKVISEKNFQNILVKLQDKQQYLLKIKETMEEQKKIINNNHELYKYFKNKIDEAVNFTKLDRTMVEFLIDKIVVAQDKNTLRTKAHIYYKFNNQ
ncbi:recombinase family protein [Clostridium sp. DJ247]|uniref:recombinase family protein n=1 Tax=Clostridium sp. DJ247 TaxID=2726188 RepID=UPI0016285806|nr:recombinase family protein [Clostridium sp. DJ247]MBC2579920.1 recombinase family protein [Clostridium sp. DJ247]